MAPREAAAAMRRRAVLLAAMLAAAALLPGMDGAAAAPTTITFLHANDVYEIAPRRGEGGFAEAMTLIRAERRRNPHTLTTFGGDLLSPSLLSGLTRGAPMIELVNAVGVDVAVPGNHEFDFGPEVAAERFEDSRFPWLGTNLLDREGRPALGTRDLLIREVAGYRIGFFGLVDPDTRILSSPGNEVRFADPVATASTAAARLRAMGADLVVALTHQDWAEDRALAAAVEGIDLVLGGHDHDPITFFEGGTLILKAGHDLHHLAVIDLTLNRRRERDRTAVVWTASWRYLSTAGVAPDPEVGAIVARWNRQLDQALDMPVGEAKVALDTRRGGVRTRESNFGNLVADALRAATGADAALVNGGGIRGDRIYPAGTVLTRKDILTELPFGNVAVLIEIKGSDLLAALEHGVSRVEAGSGRFPQVSGLSFTYDPARPAGARIVRAAVGGAPLAPERVYRLATSDYLLGGGDGYAMLARGRTIIDASGGTLVATTVMNHIAAHGGTMASKVEGRILRAD